MCNDEEQIVSGSEHAFRHIRNDRHLHDAIRFMQGQRYRQNLFWVRIPAQELSIDIDIYCAFSYV